jgi:FAD/FMN-containing dehydrogenase
MDRRRFLSAAGATAASILAGCGGGGGPSTTLSSDSPSGNQTDPPSNPANPGTPPPSNPPAAPSATDWQSLAGRLNGNLVLPADTLYDQAYVAFNSRYDGNRPQAVAQCATPDDVSEVLAFVRRFNLPVTARSGGHSYAGYSTSTGIVIDVGPMDSIELNGNIATIGAGAKLADIYDYLAARGVSIPSGSCLSVGIAGITQGGGLSVVSRTYGLTCDRLVSAQIVTADGRQLQCDASHHADLFWALRGGGGGNFGVVTSLSFQTHPIGNLTRFYASFRLEDAAHVLNEWMDWTQGLPDRIWSTAVFTINDDSVPLVFSISGICIGDQSDLETYWSDFIAATQRQPQELNSATQSYRDVLMGYCYGMTLSECHLPPQTPDAKLTRHAMTASSDMFNSRIPAEGIQALLQAVERRIASGRKGVVKIDLLGGAIGRVAADATAFVHRDTVFDAQYYAYFPAGTTAAVIDEVGSWATGMRTVMRPWSTGRAYQNYIDPRLQNWQSAYYGTHYSRLSSIKAQYDPDSVFRFSQGIAPAS